MDAKIQNEINLIKESILKTVPAEAIYLFGSYAYGTPREDSDLDIYVVVPDDTDDLIELQSDIRRLLWEKRVIALDLLMGRSSVFNHRKNAPTLEKVIAQRGTVIYGA